MSEQLPAGFQVDNTADVPAGFVLDSADAPAAAEQKASNRLALLRAANPLAALLPRDVIAPVAKGLAETAEFATSGIADAAGQVAKAVYQPEFHFSLPTASPEEMAIAADGDMKLQPVTVINPVGKAYQATGLPAPVPLKSQDWYRGNVQPVVDRALGSLDELKSPELQRQERAVSADMAAAQDTGIINQAKTALETSYRNPRAFSAMILESLPQMGVPIAAARGVRTLAGAHAALAAERASMNPALAKALVDATEHRVGAAAASVAEGIQSGEQTADQTAQAFDQIPDADLLKLSPYAKKKFEAGTPISEIRSEMVDELRAGSFRAAAAITTVASRLSGSADIEAKIAHAAPLAGTRPAQMLKQTGVGMLAEGLEEGPQSAGEQFAQNLATQQVVNPDQSLTQGVAGAGVQGALVGAASGAPLGMVRGATAPLEQAQAPPVASAEAAPVPAGAEDDIISSTFDFEPEGEPVDATGDLETDERARSPETVAAPGPDRTDSGETVPVATEARAGGPDTAAEVPLAGSGVDASPELAGERAALNSPAAGAADEPATAPPVDESANSHRKAVDESANLQRPAASWVIRNKRTGEVIAETFDKKKVAALNGAKYEAVPIQQHLAELNRNLKAEPARSLPAESPKVTKMKRTALDDKRLADPAVQGHLQHLASEAGWDQVGGKLLRDADGQPNGRTPWVASPFFVSAQRNAPLSGNTGGNATREAVRKAIAGEPMSAAEKRHVVHIADWADAERAGYDEQGATGIDPFALSSVFEDGESGVSLQDEALVAKASEIDEAAVERAAKQAEDDHPAFMEAIKEIVHGRKSEDRAAGDGRQGVQGEGRTAEGRASGAGADGSGAPEESLEGGVTPSIAGKDLGGGATAFTKESGTLGVPRAEMPQIQTIHRGALTNFLGARGISHEQEHDVDPATLKPTQAEFVPEKVQGAIDRGDERAILVSSDNHVLDGHHQLVAALQEGRPIRVIRFDAPIQQLLPAVREFPSASVADGGPAATPSSTARAAAVKAFGADGIAKLEQQGVLHFVDTWRDLPKHLQNWVKGFQIANRSTVDALIDADNRKVYIISDRVAASDVPKMLMHEIGEHFGLESMLGREGYDKLLRTVRELRKNGQPWINKAWEHVAAAYPTLSQDSDEFAREVIARAAEQPDAWKAPWWRLLLARVRAWLASKGFAGQFTDEDLGTLVAASLRRVMDADGATGYSTKTGPMAQAAFHGTPHKVDRFSLQKIGSGEGAQAYGWGLYFASNKSVAESYRKSLSDSSTPGRYKWQGKSYEDVHSSGQRDGARHAISLSYWQGPQTARKIAKQGLADAKKGEPYAVEMGGVPYYEKMLEVANAIKSRKEITHVKGNLYEVDLPEEDMLLDWGKPISKQSSSVKEALAQAGVLKRWKESRGDYSLPQEVRPDRGGALYALLAHEHGGEKGASQYLDSIGIPGMAYKAGLIANVKGGGNNFVIWNENAIGEPRVLASASPNSQADGQISDALEELVRDDLDDAEVFSKPMPKADDDRLSYVGKLGGSATGYGSFHASLRSKTSQATEPGPYEFFFHDNADNPIGFARLTRGKQQATVNMIAFKDGERGNGYGRAFYEYLLNDLGVEVKTDKEITEGTAAMYRSLSRDYRARVDPEGRVVITPEKKVANGILAAARPNPQTETPEFKRWFGDSKVVDADGKPLVVYHGTQANFDTFKTEGHGIYFGKSPEMAAKYTNLRSGPPSIIPAYLSIKNPWTYQYYESDFPNHRKEDQRIPSLEKAGFDGIYRSHDGVWIAFRPEQIKSAIGNSGTFAPKNPSILAAASSGDGNRDMFPESLSTAQQAASDAIGIKNEDTAKVRADAGLADARAALRLDFPSVRAAVEPKTAQAWRDVELLAQTLKTSPRAIEPEEDVKLAFLLTRLRNEYDTASEHIDYLHTHGDQSQIAQEMVKRTLIENQLDDLTETTKRVGTLNAQGLAFRRLMLNRDYSLAAMRATIKAERGGGPLPEEVEKQLKDMASRIKTLEQQLAEREAEKVADAEHQEVIKDAAAADPKAPENQPAERKKRGTDLAKKIKGEIDAGKKPEDYADLIQRLARNLVEQGVRDRQKLVDGVHAALKKLGADMTPREVRDAISGYGKFTALNKGDVDVALRQMRGELQQMSKIDDLVSGKVPLKTGMERQEPSDAFRELTRQYNELKKLHPDLKPIDPAKALKTSLDAIKTRLGNQIRDYNNAIAKRERIMRQRALPPTDAEVQRLKAERDAAQAQYETIFPKEKKAWTDAERAQIAENALERAVADLEKRVLTGDIARRDKPDAPTNPRIEALRTQADALRAELQGLRDAAKPAPKSADQIEIERIEKRIADITAKIIFGELPKDRKGPRETENPEVLRLRQERDSLQEWLAKLRKASPEERARLALESIKASIAEMNRRIATGELESKQQRDRVVTPELEALRQERAALGRTMREMQDAAFPGRVEARALQALKTRLTNEIARTQERIANKDYSEPVKRTVALDPAAHKLRFERDKVIREFHEMKMRDRIANWTWQQKGWHWAKEFAGLPRGLQTMLDLSAVLRQGAFIAYGHPVRAAKAFKEMVPTIWSEEAAHKALEDIYARPNATSGLYARGGLYIADQGAKLSQREEVYINRWLEQVPLLKHVYKGSERTYTTFLNRLRADSFDAMAATLARTENLTDMEAKGIAYYVNNATGRGSVFGSDHGGEIAAQIFYSPRYLTSRIAMAAGMPIVKAGSNRARRQIAIEYARFALGLVVIYGLAAMAGDDNDDIADPRSTNFGKLKFGNVHVDPLAGLSQVLVFTSRMATGEKVSGSGKLTDLRHPRYGQSDVTDVAAQFLRSKLAPIPGTIWTMLSGKDFMGNQLEPTNPTFDLSDKTLTPAELAYNSLLPLSIANVVDVTGLQAAGSDGANVNPAAKAALIGLALLGTGVSVYGD